MNKVAFGIRSPIEHIVNSTYLFSELVNNLIAN